MKESIPTIIPNTLLSTSPYQANVAKQLARQMADNQALELLTQDILNKTVSLSQLEQLALQANPSEKLQERLDFVIRHFVVSTCRKLK